MRKAHSGRQNKFSVLRNAQPVRPAAMLDQQFAMRPEQILTAYTRWLECVGCGRSEGRCRLGSWWLWVLLHGH